MTCPRCQAENDAGTRFCEDCGARLQGACPSCGTPVTPGKKFCRSCGAALTPEPSRFTSPESYTPKHLAEKILTSKGALEGERKQLTVLFADLKGSMELLADRDPEEARTLLDPVLEHMMEAVHRYEGTVNQVMGDGIMALFGAPLAHEDHAVRACYAALRMQENVKRYAEGVFRSHGVLVQIRVGLNSGEVVVRSIGSDLHMDYTAVGQTTHLAARMEQMATPGTILLAPETLVLAEGFVQVTARGSVPVKGLAEPVEVYELTGASAIRSRLQASAARGLTRFVGRDPEMEQLRRALALAAEGHGQLVAVIGEPGVGKSRLVHEFTHSHRTQDWLIVEANSVSYGKATSYLPVIDLLKGYFKVTDRDTRREIREKVTGKLLTLDEGLRPILSPVLALLDVPVEDAQWTNLDPEQRRPRTLDAVKRLLLRETQVQPLLVVFEDLQWIDGETQAMLDGLVESLPAARLLLLVNYRPEYSHGWGSKTAYSQLRLDSLPVESAAELLGALLGPDPGLVPLTQMLVKRGNPFFLEETVRMLAETGALAGERGAYRLTRPVEALQVPATVQTSLAARIDRLPAEEKQLLQVASVIGKDVPYALLRAVAKLAEDAVQRGLTHLQAAEFLYETRLFPDPEYTFKHALTHEVTYGTLVQERRKALHARIVGAIERCYPDRLTEHVERLAHHAVRGERWEQAVTYLRQAGVKVASRSALRESVACFEQALAALGHLPESRETLEQAIDLRFLMRDVFVPLGEFGRLRECLREAEALATALNDRTRLGWVSASLSHLFYLTDEPQAAIESGERALSIGLALDDFTLQVRATLHLGQAHHGLGNFRRAIDFLRRNVEALQGERIRDRFGRAMFVYTRTWLVFCLAELGEFAEAIGLGEEALPMAEALDQPWNLVHACWSIGVPYLAKGDVRSAIPVFERSLTLCRTRHVPFGAVESAFLLGRAYMLAGRVAEGLALLEETEAHGSTMGHPHRLAVLGFGYLRAGRTGAALAVARRALDLAREGQERGTEAWVLRLLGEIASSEEPPEVGRAQTSYRQALALAETLGMRPLVAHCHLGLGKLYRRTSKRQEAQEHLTTATTMYREMDMQFFLEKAEAEMKELV